jgi:hypothetical protein
MQQAVLLAVPFSSEGIGCSWDIQLYIKCTVRDADNIGKL